MYNFTSYLQDSLPEHKKTMDLTFLAWFIGFYEGDGTFVQWRTNKTPNTEPFNRFQCTIEQKNNPALLYHIRTTLGFGTVTHHSRGATFRVGKKKDLLKLLVLFHGNLTLPHRIRQLDQIIQNMTLAGWDLPQSLQTPQVASVPPSLETAWLAGFFDADAGFWSNRSNNFLSDGGLRVRIQLKFYVTQICEDEEILLQIGELFQPNACRVYRISNGHTSQEYSRLELTRGTSHDRLLMYLKRFPLKGSRRIDVKVFELLRTRQLHRGARVETAKMAQRTARLLERFSTTRKEKFFL